MPEIRRKEVRKMKYSIVEMEMKADVRLQAIIRRGDISWQSFQRVSAVSRAADARSW